MLKLDNLKPRPGSRKGRKRVGRGNASHGTYSGRGGKGQTARAGFRIPPGFEGGQTPLWKRVPKRGFTNFSRREYACVNLDDLSERFEGVKEITPELMLESGLLSALKDGVKVLARGECKGKLTVTAHRFSKQAAEKIEKAGGKAIWLEPNDSDESGEAEVAAKEAPAKAEEKPKAAKAKAKPKE